MLSDPWLGVTLVHELRVVQPISQGERLYRAENDRGLSLYAHFTRLGDVDRDWLTQTARLSELQPPRFCRFVEAFEVRGHAVLLSEYQAGCRLDDRLRNSGPLPARDACRIAFDVAIALQSMHAIDLVHARVGPQNVLLTLDPQRGFRATMLCCGVASGLSEPPSKYAPSHLPPQRADVYSVGAILLFALSGSPPGPAWAEQLRAALSMTEERRPGELATVVNELMTTAEMTIHDAVDRLQTVMDGLNSTPTARQTRQRTAEAAPRQRKATTRREPTDVPRQSVIRLDGEPHMVQPDGSVLKFRNLSSGQRWGPQSTQVDLASLGIGGEITSVCAHGPIVWFGTSLGLLGKYNVRDEAASTVFQLENGGRIVSIDANAGLAVGVSAYGDAIMATRFGDATLLPSAAATCVSVAAHGGRFAVGCAHGAVQIYVAEGDAVRVLAEIDVPGLVDMKLSREGTHLSVRDEGSTRVVEVASQRVVGDFGAISDLLIGSSRSVPGAND